MKTGLIEKRTYFIRLVSIFILCFLFFQAHALHAEANNTDENLPKSTKSAKWIKVAGRYFDIYYEPSVNIKYINRRLENKFFSMSGSSQSKSISSQKEKLSTNMDMILLKVKEILNMYPRMKKAKIYIYKDRDGVKQEHLSIFRKKSDAKSFYIYKHNTIYTNAKDISDSIMSHEMAHMVVDNYFAVRPPDKIKEILSMYVDRHLDD